MKRASRLVALLLAFCPMLLGDAAASLQAQSHDVDYDEVDQWAGVKPADKGPDSSAVAGFLKSLGAADPVVCQFAAQAIGNNWNDGDGEYETGELVSEAAQEKTRRALSRRVTDPAALSHLAHALSDPHTCVRRAAARMLGRSEAPEGVRQLREALQHRDGRVREAAALGLGEAEDPATFHDLTRALRDKEQPVVRMAAYALGELEDARAVKPLGELLGAAEWETRAAAATALGEIEDIRITGRISRLVNDAEPRVRVAAIHALGEIEDHRSTSALTKALRDETVQVRRAAAAALGEVENPKAAGPLSEAIGDVDVVVRRLAAQSLGELDNLVRAPSSLMAALGATDPELRVIAALSLGEIGDSAAVPALSKAYAGSDARFRYARFSVVTPHERISPALTWRKDNAAAAVASVGACSRSVREDLSSRQLMSGSTRTTVSKEARRQAGLVTIHGVMKSPLQEQPTGWKGTGEPPACAPIVGQCIRLHMPSHRNQPEGIIR